MECTCCCRAPDSVGEVCAVKSVMWEGGGGAGGKRAGVVRRVRGEWERREVNEMKTVG